MSILFSNPPWWETKESRGLFRKKRWRRGVRAGSRWPFTYIGRSSPDNSKLKTIFLPLFSWLCCTYVANKIGKEKVYFRDSIAISESYESFYKYVDLDKKQY